MVAAPSLQSSEIGLEDYEAMTQSSEPRSREQRAQYDYEV